MVIEKVDGRKFQFFMLDVLDACLNNEFHYFDISEKDFEDVVIRFRDRYKCRYVFHEDSTDKVFTSLDSGFDEFIVKLTF